uniref:Helicase-associated domain-containing protein n=1 Tax=Odontella aurita TaxID=265563 RepID=A0A7S4N2E2_9STRA
MGFEFSKDDDDTDGGGKSTKGQTFVTKSWRKRLGALREFKAKHGHCRVTRDDDRTLYHWLRSVQVEYQRCIRPSTEGSVAWPRRLHKQLLSKQQVAELKVIFGEEEVVVESEDDGQSDDDDNSSGGKGNKQKKTSSGKRMANFIENAHKMRDFKSVSGHCKHEENGVQSWMFRVRKRYQQMMMNPDDIDSSKKTKHPRLREEEIAVLEESGICWKTTCQCKKASNVDKASSKHTWESRILQLRNFRVEHGKFDPDKCDDKGLIKWMRSVRRDYRKYKSGKEFSLLDSEKIAELEELCGPDELLDPQSKPFDRSFVLMKEHRENTGHCHVGWDKPKLRRWVMKIRQDHNRIQRGGTPRTLSAEKVKMLDDIGFCWSTKCKHLTENAAKELEKQDNVEGGAYFEKGGFTTDAKTDFSDDDSSEDDVATEALAKKAKEDEGKSANGGPTLPTRAPMQQQQAPGVPGPYSTAMQYPYGVPPHQQQIAHYPGTGAFTSLAQQQYQWQAAFGAPPRLPQTDVDSDGANDSGTDIGEDNKERQKKGAQLQRKYGKRMAKFLENAEKVYQYREVFGRCKHDDKGVQGWLFRVRDRYQRGNVRTGTADEKDGKSKRKSYPLDESEILALERAGICYQGKCSCPGPQNFIACFELFKKHKESTGHCDVGKDMPGLRQWVGSVRNLHDKLESGAEPTSALDPHKIEMLVGIDFCWTSKCKHRKGKDSGGVSSTSEVKADDEYTDKLSEALRISKSKGWAMPNKTNTKPIFILPTPHGRKQAGPVSPLNPMVSSRVGSLTPQQMAQQQQEWWRITAGRPYPPQFPGQDSGAPPGPLRDPAPWNAWPQPWSQRGPPSGSPFPPGTARALPATGTSGPTENATSERNGEKVPGKSTTKKARKKGAKKKRKHSSGENEQSDEEIEGEVEGEDRGEGEEAKNEGGDGGQDEFKNVPGKKRKVPSAAAIKNRKAETEHASFSSNTKDMI